MASSLPRPLALTMGDACGIGPEIIAAWFRSADAGSAFVVGDVAVMRRAVGFTGGLLPVARIDAPDDAAALPAGCVPVLQADGVAPDLIDAPLGRVDARDRQQPARERGRSTHHGDVADDECAARVGRAEPGGDDLRADAAGVAHRQGQWQVRCGSHCAIVGATPSR